MLPCFRLVLTSIPSIKLLPTFFLPCLVISELLARKAEGQQFETEVVGYWALCRMGEHAELSKYLTVHVTHLKKKSKKSFRGRVHFGVNALPK